MSTITAKIARLSRVPRDTYGVNWSPSDRAKSALLFPFVDVRIRFYSVTVTWST